MRKWDADDSLQLPGELFLAEDGRVGSDVRRHVSARENSNSLGEAIRVIAGAIGDMRSVGRSGNAGEAYAQVVRRIERAQERMSIGWHDEV